MRAYSIGVNVNVPEPFTGKDGVHVLIGGHSLNFVLCNVLFNVSFKIICVVCS